MRGLPRVEAFEQLDVERAHIGDAALQRGAKGGDGGGVRGTGMGDGKWGPTSQKRAKECETMKQHLKTIRFG